MSAAASETREIESDSRDRSFFKDIRTRLIVAIVVVVGAASALGLMLNLNYDANRIRQATIENNLMLLNALSIDFFRVIQGQSLEYQAELVSRLKSFPDVRNVLLHDIAGAHVFSYDRDPADFIDLHSLIEYHDVTAIVYTEDGLLLHKMISHDGSNHGWVTIHVDTLALQVQLESYYITVIMLVAGTAVSAVLLSLLVGFYFTRPVRKLAAFTRKVGKGRDFSQQIQSREGGDIGDLYDGMNSLLREITHAQDEIQRINDKRVRSIIDTSLDGAVTTDADGMVTYWGKENARIFGWEEKEILGRSLVETIVATRFRHIHAEELKYFLEYGEHSRISQRFEVVGQHRDGHEILVEMSVSASLDEQGLVFHAFFRDLTRLREAESELREVQLQLLNKERLAAVGQLTATVAHELRNPMGTISNSLYTLGKTLDNEDTMAGQILERIERNVHRCNIIISELLDFARDREIRLQSIALDGWLKRVLENYDCADDVKIVYTGAEDIWVRIDSVYFESAIINLLDNAVDAVRERHTDGGGCIEVDIVTGGGRVAVVVGDNGSGINENDLVRIMEPLFSTKVYGVGLGLPTVKKIVDKHRGEIVIKTNGRGGLSVCLWLPPEQRPAADVPFVAAS